MSRKKTHEDPGFGAAPDPSDRTISPQDIQQKEFRVSRMGGYRMRDVDEYLDELTAAVERLVQENERLRGGGAVVPVVGAPDLDDVSRQADEIIRRAREEASRIVAEASERAASVAGSTAAAAADPAARGAIDAFLIQERTFLQDLASLVQGHADSVKQMARRSRKGPAPAEVGPAEGSPDEEEPETRDEPADLEEPSAAVEEDAGAAPDDRTEAGPGSDRDATQALEERPSPDKTSAEGGDGSLRELFWGEDS